MQKVADDVAKKNTHTHKKKEKSRFSFFTYFSGGVRKGGEGRLKKNEKNNLSMKQKTIFFLKPLPSRHVQIAPHEHDGKNKKKVKLNSKKKNI